MNVMDEIWYDKTKVLKKIKVLTFIADDFHLVYFQTLTQRRLCSLQTQKSQFTKYPTEKL